ncbi:MAG: PEP-CTERM sorting domain-containing protein [Deltaproteobacteria bacterium]|nr:PEP-CTERM sorting domain-containing protein [Deltaproteobacteria bacterium]
MKNYYLKTLLLGLIAWLIFISPVYGTPLTTDYKSFAITFAEGSPTTSGNYDPTDPYMIGTDPWVANLLPLQPTYLRSVSSNFANVLDVAFPTSAGWTYQSSVNELSDDSLVVHTYDVQGTSARVGAEFHMEYVPHGTDPTSNIHWIQVITDNHAIPEGHGTQENEVDNPHSPSGRSPYYDDRGAANSTDFYDFPVRPDANMSHNWIAELFLVTGPSIGTSGNIIFHGGVKWGWENHPVPEPSTWLLFGSGLVVLVKFRRKSLFKKERTQGLHI